MSCQPPLQFLLLGFSQCGLIRLGGDAIPDRLHETNSLIDAQRDNLSQGGRQIHDPSMCNRTSNMSFGYSRMKISYPVSYMRA